ncbi:hypothetical protein ABT282_08745 [Streptomyces sp. NPDC000927]|uniref:hypothetical protein n=1 Tax=Streptomyces sp. NPDC000927 TaxID=3154371 RepID=UPI003320EC6D
MNQTETYFISKPYEWSDMEEKFCSSCKPWTVFADHIEDFPSPKYNGRGGFMLGRVRLTDLPDAWVS